MMAATQRRPSSQRGAVLLVGMVMLMLVTLIALGIIRLSTQHTLIVNNEQVRGEATSAANYALDMMLNAPATSWDQFKGAGTSQYVNLGMVVAGDDGAANSVEVKVQNLDCRRARVLKNAELVKKSAGFFYVEKEDASCFGGGGTPLTIVDPSSAAASSDGSLCATVFYEVQAHTAGSERKLLGAGATVTQGVEVRTDITSMDGSCS
jgi:hypothetical protein